MAQIGSVVIKKNDFPKIIRENPGKIDKAITAWCFDGQRHVRQSIQNSPASGRTYTKENGVKHTASSPGNPPRIDDGILINSITFRKIRELTRLFEAGVDYAIALEFGTSRMAARPFFGPMVAYMQANAVEFFENLIAE